MAKAQGALEYLIIIAAVLGIAAVSVLFLTSTSAAAKSPASISACRVAASNCGLRTATGVTTSCPECDIACKDLATGQEVFIGAATACKAGRTTSIVGGSNYTVGLVQDAGCQCVWTVGAGCDTWWYNRLVQKGFNVEFIGASVISDVNSMKKYKAILNPYGEDYLDYGADPYAALDNIREYVRQGGYWFEYGGWSLYYSCSANADPHEAGGQRVCIGITWTGSTEIRNVTAYGKTVSPNGPISTIEFNPGGCYRPSTGNDFTSYSAACSALASGASYNPIYLNTTLNYAGPVAHCYGGGCLVKSDRLSNDEDIATIYADFMRSKVF